MKASQFKKIIKEAVREAIREELKDILFEAFKSQTPALPLVESKIPIPTPTTPVMSLEAKRSAYGSVLDQTNSELSLNSTNAQHFQPQAGMDNTNGALPAGSISMEQITGLMGK